MEKGKSRMALRRLTKEAQNVMNNPIHGITAIPREDNVYIWDIILNGPRNTPYEGGVFYGILTLPDNYPFSPPKVKFTTSIYHPNINLKGEICLDVLGDNWGAALSIRIILLGIYAVIKEPNIDDPLMVEIATLYKNNIERFNEIAIEETKKHAIKE